MALTEFVAFIILLAARAAGWAEEIVFYVSDNMSVKDWIRSKKTTHPHARVLLRLLQRIEARFDIRVLCFYVRTYHNVLADWLTRETRIVVQKGMKETGFVKLELDGSWTQMIEQVVRRTYLLPGESGHFGRPCQREISPQRMFQPPPGLALGLGLCVELNTLLCPFAKERI